VVRDVLSGHSVVLQVERVDRVEANGKSLQDGMLRMMKR